MKNEELMFRNKDENKLLDPHFVPEGQHENSPVIHRWASRKHPSPSPIGRMNIGIPSTIFPDNQWLGSFRMLLTEQLQRQVLWFDDDCVTSVKN